VCEQCEVESPVQQLLHRGTAVMAMTMLPMLVALLTVVVVDGHLDLFMNETETKRLLGE